MDNVLKILESIGWTGIVVSLSAFLIGVKFPDWDFKLKLKHRNILTHSPIIIFFFLSLYFKERTELFRFFIIGFSIAMGIHLIFDFFPKGWARGALLHVPLINLELNKNISRILFLISIVISYFIAIKMTRTFEEYIFFFVLTVIYILKSFVREQKFIRPFLVFIVIYFLIGNIDYQKNNIKMYKNINKNIKSFSFIDKLS